MGFTMSQSNASPNAAPNASPKDRPLYLLSPGGQPVRGDKAIPHSHFCYEGDKEWTPAVQGRGEASGQPTTAKDSENNTPLLGNL
jgi:hypothetical protein